MAKKKASKATKKKTSAKKKAVVTKKSGKKSSKKRVTSASRKPVKKSAVKKTKKRQGAKTSSNFSEPITDQFLELIFDLESHSDSISRESLEFFEALSESNSKKVKAHLSAGADPNQTLFEHYTPLMVAAHADVTSVVKLLLDSGADPTDTLVLLFAVDSPAITKSLLKAGADPNGSDGHQTPIGRAIEHRSRAVVKLLVDAGGKVGEAERKIAKQVGDAQIDKLIGATDPPPKKLFIPPLLSKPMKEGYRRVFELTLWPPLGFPDHGLKVFACQIEPERFLSPNDAIRDSAPSRAADRLFDKLWQSVEGCEFVRSNMRGETVILLDSKNKFYFLSKPTKLFKWLKSVDEKYPVSLYQNIGGCFYFRFNKRVTAGQAKQLRLDWQSLGLAEDIEVDIKTGELVVSFD